MRRALVIILLLLCHLTSAQSGTFVNYGAEDGLSSNTVYAVVQDADGSLWIGTRNGLDRFDGARFQVWKEELPSLRVSALGIDADNRLWIGTTAGLCVRSGESFYPGPQHHIRAIRAASDGSVWAATIDGLLLKLSFDPARGVTEHARLEYSIVNFEGDYPYQQIYEDSEGRLWMGGRIVHCQFVEDKAAPTVQFRFHPDCSMGSYAEARGRLYAYSDFLSTLCTFEGERINVIGKVPIAHASLLTDSRGRLWAAGSYGLALVDVDEPESSKVYRHIAGDPNSLSSGELYCIFEDAQGNLWLGGDNGLSAFCPSMQQVRRPEGLESNQITALMQASDGRLWVGTADRGAYACDLVSGKVENVDYRPSGRANEGRVSCLYEDRSGRVFIGLWAGCGFNIVENGKVRRGAISGPIPKQQHVVASEDRITANWISDFLEDSRGRFWVVSWEGVGLNEWDRRSGKTLPPQWLSPFKYPVPQLDSNIYLSSRLGSRLIEAPDGKLVYGTTEAGLNIIDINSGLVTKYLHSDDDPESLPDDYVTDLCIAPDGALWASTRAGLWTDRGGRFLNGMLVQSVRADSSGRIWAGTEEGLYFIDNEGSIGVVRSGLGMPSDIYSEKTACVLNDGSLAFGGPGGVAIFNPDSLLASPVPEVLISELVQDGRRLSFSFSSNILPLAPQLLYRYRLEGEDKDWVEARFPNLQVRYGLLRPGRYTLRVECSDQFGRWTGKEYSRDLRVRPPLLLRWPFLLLYAILLLAIVRLAMILRERRLRQDNARLEAAVKEKTARIQDELDTRNQIFSIISHDLRGPVYSVKLLSDELSGKLDSLSKEDIQLALDKLRDAAGSTSTLLENLLLWSLNQKGVLEPVMREENLEEIVNRAVDSIREAAEEKQVRIETLKLSGISVLTDRNMLDTCLRNLLANAVKYSPKGSLVEVKAGDNYISVRDHGPGMDASVQKTLYKRGHLGLVITRDLLDKMGGSLSSRNPEDGGCEMTITLK